MSTYTSHTHTHTYVGSACLRATVQELKKKKSPGRLSRACITVSGPMTDDVTYIIQSYIGW